MCSGSIRSAIHQSCGGRADHHPTRRSDGLHPLSHPDLLTHSGVTKGPEPISQRSPGQSSARRRPEGHAIALPDFDSDPLASSWMPSAAKQARTRRGWDCGYGARTDTLSQIGQRRLHQRLRRIRDGSTSPDCTSASGRTAAPTATGRTRCGRLCTRRSRVCPSVPTACSPARVGARACRRRRRR